MEPCSAVLGWGDEHSLVTTASQHSVYVHAADFVSNLAYTSNLPPPPPGFFAQRTLRQAPPVTQTHTVCFLMSDGDNLQWYDCLPLRIVVSDHTRTFIFIRLLRDFAVSPQWYGSPDRGLVSMGWTAPPVLSELAPQYVTGSWLDCKSWFSAVCFSLSLLRSACLIYIAHERRRAVERCGTCTTKQPTARL